MPRPTPLFRILLLLTIVGAPLGGCGGGSGDGGSGGGLGAGGSYQVYVETGPDNDRGVYVAGYDGGAVPLHRGPMTFSIRRGSLRDAFSADGSWALYVGNDDDAAVADIVVVRLADGARRVLDSFTVADAMSTSSGLLAQFSGVWSSVGHRVAVNHLINPDPAATTTTRLYEAATGDYDSIFGDGPGSGHFSVALWQPGGPMAQLLSQSNGLIRQYVAAPSGYWEQITPLGEYQFDGLSLAWSPDGQHTGAVVLAGGQLRAYSAPAGTAPGAPFLVLAPGVELKGSPLWSPDSTRVLYGADVEAPDHFELFVLPASGGLLRKVGAAGPQQSIPSNGEWAAGGARVVFRRDHAIDGPSLVSTDVATLLATPIAVPGPQRGFYFWHVSPAGDRVAYVTFDASGFADMRVMLVDVTGANEVEVDLDAPYMDTASFQWSPDGTHLFVSGILDPLGFEERALLVDASGQPVAPALPPGHFKDFEWSEDGSHFAYVVEDLTSGADTLHVGRPGSSTLSRPLDGTGVTTVRNVLLR